MYICWFHIPFNRESKLYSMPQVPKRKYAVLNRFFQHFFYFCLFFILTINTFYKNVLWQLRRYCAAFLLCIVWLNGKVLSTVIHWKISANIRMVVNMLYLFLYLGRNIYPCHWIRSDISFHLKTSLFSLCTFFWCWKQKKNFLMHCFDVIIICFFLRIVELINWICVIHWHAFGIPWCF